MEVVVMEVVPMSVGDIVDVAIPLRLVSTVTLMGVLVGIIEVDGTDKPETVAEMTTPTVAHSFCANIRVPISLISECASKASTICRTNQLGLMHHIVLRCKLSGY
jgi:hypothetical protein